MNRHSVLLVALFLSIPGCLSVYEVKKDQDKMRSAILDLYTDQIMDNLIRAANGLPMVQLDYTQAQGMVTVKETAGFSDSQAATVTNELTLPFRAAKQLVKTGNILTTLMGSVNAENTNQVTLTAVPVTTSNEVYDAYLEFLTLPGSLIVSCDKPNPAEVHLCRKFDKNYFYVPKRYRQEFLRLSLLTTVQRGKALLAPDEFFKVTLVEQVPGPTNDSKTKTLVTVRLGSDNPKGGKMVPNDTGYLKIDGDNTEYNVVQTDDINGNKPSRLNAVTVSVPNDKLPDFLKFPKSATLFLDHAQPKPPTTDDLLNRVNIQLQQIQNNQVRQGGL